MLSSTKEKRRPASTELSEAAFDGENCANLGPSPETLIVLADVVNFGDVGEKGFLC